MNLPSFDKAPGAIAIDLDGTLLNSQSQLSERNCTAINMCVSYGVPIVIATSRPARILHRLLGEDLARKCSLVLMNGAYARGAPPLSGIIREKLLPEVASDIIQLILGIEPGARLTVELEGYEFGTNVRIDPVTLWKMNAATPDMVLTLDEALARIPAKVAVGGLERDLSAVASEVSRQFGDLISVITANRATFLNITSAKASKPNALKRLLHFRQIPLADVVAFGDDVPDVGMLAECGIPIAVANAASDVIAVADYQTASNDDDGVAIVLERILEILEK
jgi:Cof subfamily protein (haloacid dehalogenase superfamily)